MDRFWYIVDKKGIYIKKGGEIVIYVESHFYLKLEEERERITRKIRALEFEIKNSQLKKNSNNIETSK